MKTKLGVLAGLLFPAFISLAVSSSLYPLDDRDPLGFTVKSFRNNGQSVESSLPLSGKPLSVRLQPDHEFWNCSKKVWLLLDVENQGAESIVVRAAVSSKKSKAWGSCKGAVRVPPGRMCTLPILVIRGELKGREEGLKRLFNKMRGYPGGHQQTSWRVIDATRLTDLQVDFFSKGDSVHAVLSNLRGAVDFSVPSDAVLKRDYIPAMDEYGQNRNADWNFKIHADSDFADRLAAEEQYLESLPPLKDRSRFGGWTGGFSVKGSGHFRTLEKEGRWWLIDPDGFPFWSVGATGFNQSLGKANSPGLGRVNPRRTNLMKKYGTDWEQTSAQFTHRRLRAWGMNTLGNWSSPSFYKMDRTPYTVACHFTRPSMYEPNKDAHSSLPDVFHPDFRKRVFDAVSRFSYEASDPWCIGYFIDNELPFQQPATPAKKALLSGPSCASRQEFIRQLEKKYGTIAQMNEAWETTYDHWAAIRETGSSNKVKMQDMLTFSEAWYRTYYKTCREAMRTYAPDTLYLGSRINHTENGLVLRICAEYADVVSINFYDYTPDQFVPPEGFNAPVLIGEFHFGTITERGMWGGGLCTAMNMQQASDLFAGYVRDAIRNPLMVGTHWFKFSDQPLTGRSDGENYRIGFVDVADTPYPEMVRACRAVAETMYPLRAGLKINKE